MRNKVAHNWEFITQDSFHHYSEISYTDECHMKSFPSVFGSTASLFKVSMSVTTKEH